MKIACFLPPPSFFSVRKFYICHPNYVRDVAQSGSVLAWGASGRWFESSHPDEENPTLLRWIFCLRKSPSLLERWKQTKKTARPKDLLDFLQFHPLSGSPSACEVIQILLVQGRRNPDSEKPLPFIEKRPLFHGYRGPTELEIQAENQAEISIHHIEIGFRNNTLPVHFPRAYFVV